MLERAATAIEGHCSRISDNAALRGFVERDNTAEFGVFA